MTYCAHIYSACPWQGSVAGYKLCCFYIRVGGLKIYMVGAGAMTPFAVDAVNQRAFIKLLRGIQSLYFILLIADIRGVTFHATGSDYAAKVGEPRRKPGAH